MDKMIWESKCEIFYSPVGPKTKRLFYIFTLCICMYLYIHVEQQDIGDRGEKRIWILEHIAFSFEIK